MHGVGRRVVIPESDARSPNGVREPRLAVLQGTCRFVPLIHIETQSDRAQRTPGRVALDDPAALLYPYPGIVAIAEPILDVIRRSVTVQMSGQRLPVGREILGMYSRRPQLLVPVARERRKLRVLA